VIEEQQAPSGRGRTGGATQRQTGREDGSGGGFMKLADRDGDGKVAKNEFRGPAEHSDFLDENSDGYITEDEAPTGPPANNRNQP